MLKLPSVFALLQVDRNVAEDVIDRLNFASTVYLIGFFALITGSKQHFGHPIQCLVPPESIDTWANYYHDYCYIQEKTKINLHAFDAAPTRNTPDRSANRSEFDTLKIIHNDINSWQPQVVYYQWVPYALFLQAVFFILPRFLWQFLAEYFCYGLDFQSAVEEAGNLVKKSMTDRTDSLERLASFISNILEFKRKKGFFGRHSLGVSYLLTKWVMVINVVGQLFLLAHFIGEGDQLWGYKVVLSIINNASRDPTRGIFPRVVHCTVVQLASVGEHRQIHKMQCVLMQNFINEKIYGFLYFWLLMVFVLNIISAVRCSLIVLVPDYRNCVADSILPTQDVLCASASAGIGIHTNPLQDRSLLEFFINNVLRVDGVLLLIFIHNHVGGLVTHDVALKLWKITVQPTHQIDYAITDDHMPSYKCEGHGIRRQQWPYINRSPKVADPGKIWDPEKRSVRRVSSRSRSLSVGDLFVGSVNTVANSNADETRPLNPKKVDATRGIALFDHRRK